MPNEKTLSFGWLPDLPDHRDWHPETKEIKDMMKDRPLKTIDLPSSVDLRYWCSPVEDQGNLGSCTANACIGLVEYYEIRKFGRFIDASRLFLYKTTRKLLGLTGDTGAFIRTTIKALRLFGVPPEKFYPYVIEEFDAEPPAFCYAFAANYQTISYFRLDTPGKSSSDLLELIKATLAHQYPLAFGFTVYDSIYKPEVRKTGDIPYPEPWERAIGGHAVMAVGYDDEREVIKIRNSWGEEWGDEGYGTLPYAYVENGLARDFWCILQQEWVDVMDFE